MRSGSAETQLRHIGESAMNAEELKSFAAAAWHEFEILLIKPSDVHQWEDKQHLINIGNKIYGQRR